MNVKLLLVFLIDVAKAIVFGGNWENSDAAVYMGDRVSAVSLMSCSDR